MISPLYFRGMNTSFILQGRLIQPEDLETIRTLCAGHPDWHRTQLSKELCRCWQWVDATGRLKDMACRSLLAKLEQRQLVALPARRRPRARRGRAAFQPVLHATEPIGGALHELLPLQLHDGNAGAERLLWQTLLSLSHYLGFTTKVGKNLSYLIRDRHHRPVACLLFGAAAWKTAPRDRFIGWTPADRLAHLEKVVNNMRFLVPPWVQVPHLASHVLGRVLRQLPVDWQRQYGHPIYPHVRHHLSFLNRRLDPRGFASLKAHRHFRLEGGTTNGELPG